MKTEITLDNTVLWGIGQDKEYVGLVRLTSTEFCSRQVSIWLPYMDGFVGIDMTIQDAFKFRNALNSVLGIAAQG